MTMASAQEITVGQIAIRFLLEGSETAGAAAMFEFDVAAGARVPIPHSHDGYEETIYGLAGTLTWTVDGVTTEVGPGRGPPHFPRRRAPVPERGTRTRRSWRS